MTQSTRACHSARIWLILSLIALLCGCGFQLRSQDVKPLAGHHIMLTCAAAQHWHLCTSLRRELEAAGVTLSDSGPLKLSVGNARTEQRALALTLNADTAEYLVKLSVDVSFSNGQPEQESVTATLSGSHTVRSRDVAAMKQGAEMNAIHSAIQLQLARDIANWLAFQLPIFSSTVAANETQG